jgi:hypothetical protein
VGARRKSRDVSGDSNEETDVGSAYVFQRTGTNTWDTGTQITASDAADGDFFGSSVAISGDYAVVGAPEAGFGGSTYIYQRTGTGNTWDAGTKITASAGHQDRFGVSVAISGSYAIVGAHEYDGDDMHNGSAYIFERTGTGNTWDTGTRITSPDPAPNDEFGYSVAISGDYAIVGVPFDDKNGTNSGSAQVFLTPWD